jgi:hypothetical protein
MLNRPRWATLHPARWGACCVGAASFILLTTGVALATERHVSTQGSDSNAGTSGSPWRTIQHAGSSAQPGDTVWVHPDGVYNEKPVIGNSGNAGAPITLQSVKGGAKAIIDGNGLGLGPYDPLVHISGSNVVFADFEVRNGGVCLFATGSSLVVSGNNVHDCQENGVLAQSAHSVRFESNSVHGASVSRLTAAMRGA